MTKRLSILGSTGSIGTQSLDVVDKRGYEVVALTAHSNADIIENQIRKYKPKYAAMVDEKAAQELKIKVADTDTRVLSGIDGVCECAAAEEADTVINSVVGMAGLMSGVMQAPMTAIFLIAEITGGYSLLMPLIITSAISFATIRLFEPYSIYTKRIAKEGALLTHDSDQAVLTLLKTDDLIETDFSKVGLEFSLRELVQVIAHSKRNLYPVVDDKNVVQGILQLDDVREVMFDTSKYDSTYVYTYMKQAPDFVYHGESMESVMNKFEFTGAWNLPVVDETGKYLGFVSKSKIFSVYREQLQQVSHD